MKKIVDGLKRVLGKVVDTLDRVVNPEHQGVPIAIPVHVNEPRTYRR